MQRAIKHSVAIFTLAYLAIEIQAILFVLDIFSIHVNTKTLSEYERFGYASVGIGVSLLFIKSFVAYPPVNKKISLILLVMLTSPIIYFISTWGVYEIINRSTEFVPNESKPKALQVSINMLTDPSYKNAFSFYLDNASVKIEPPLIKKYVRVQPHSDKLVRSFYIKGVKGVYLFSKYYETQTKFVDKKGWDNLLLTIRRAAYYDGVLPSELFGSIAQGEILKAFLLSVNPFTLLDAYIEIKESAISDEFGYDIHLELLSDIIKDNTSINDLFSIKSMRKASRFYDNNKYWDLQMNNEAWKLLRNHWTFLPAKYNSNIGPMNSARIHYSENALSKYGITDVIFPWNSKRNVFYDSEYVESIKMITPFFFDADGMPVNNLENFRNKKKKDLYVNNLQIGLHKNLRGFWDKYRFESLSRLTTDHNAWENQVESELNSDLIRVSVILPIMLLFSLSLVLLNLYLLVKVSWHYASTGIVVISIMNYSHGGEFTKWILDTIIFISVKESQIFLY
jgi:hypothetical protein